MEKKKKDSLLNRMVLGKLYSNMKKSDIGLLFYIIHKNKLKMDESSKCDRKKQQNPQREHRQQPFLPWL